MINKAISVIIALMLLVGVGHSQTSRPLSVNVETPTITFTTASATSTAVQTLGMHQMIVHLKFGTVSGTYTTCTVQAKTTFNGVDYLTIGSAIAITVTSNTVNVWRLVEGTGSVASTTEAVAFGRDTKFTITCSGAYGTSAAISSFITISSPIDSSSSGNLGDVSTETTLLAVLAAVSDTTPVAVNLAGASSGGATPYSHISDGSTVSYNVKNSAGLMYKIDVTNTLASAMYVRAYNTSSAPTCTSATGIVARWIIPAATTGSGGSFVFPVGKEFTTGIGLCVTSNISDTGSTAVSSGSVVVNVDYD